MINNEVLTKKILDLKVCKRNGTVVAFDSSKVKNAIIKAMESIGVINKEVATNISIDALFNFKELDVVSIDKIESFVYDSLIENGLPNVARSYEGYRAVQEYKRITNTTDDSILGLVKKTNEEVMNENSNKNSFVASTQRDLIAGEVSKDIARRKLIPARQIQAHDEGAIHIHDMDYIMQPIFNCFSGDTKFVTNLGVMRFNQCNDGQVVEVLDKNGTWRKATVRKYNKQHLQTITLTSGKTVKKIRATKNHRWLLKNGNITTDLKVGDKLHLLEKTNLDNINNDMFCFGFILGDGSDYDTRTSTGIKARLCGEKINLLDKFIAAGYTVSSYKQHGSDDVFLTKATHLSKNDFLTHNMWRYLSKEDKISLFLGYYAADGFKDRNGIATTSKHLAQMIREISALAGYHITSEKFQIRNTNYKQNAELYTFRFMKYQRSNRNWIVKDINREDRHLYDTWCVEEPITKTFTLDSGIVTGNCCLIDLEDMFEHGTVINEKLVETPKSFMTACTIATQIVAQVASNQYGGQSITIRHIAPFLRVTYEKYYEKYKQKLSECDAKEMATDKMYEELKAGVQTIRYQLSTLMTTNGQAPFLTIYLEIEEGHEYEAEQALICEEMIIQRLEGMKNENGQEIGETFPKLVYVLDEHNCLKGGKYDYITKLAAKCNVKRLVPDYQSAKIMRENYEGGNFPPMGCRSHLSVWRDENGKQKWYGRFNQGVVSLNLPQIGIIANGNMELFWDILHERLQLCKETLLTRHKLLLGTSTKTSPIHWQHGAISRLSKNDTIDSLLKDGYSTISLGYVGVHECVQAMLGVSHTTPKGENFALDILKVMREHCDKWKKETGLGFGLYGTPAESLTSRFCAIDKEKFGVIKNVTDKMYYTNSYHVHVCENIDAFSKLKFESQFHAISSGGCISYVEVPNMMDNIEAVEEVIKYIYDNIQYAEINTKADVCYKCGYSGEMLISEELEWSCPNCGNKDKDEMQVMRRTCGYLGSNFWSKGRTSEIKERVLHL